MKLYDGYQNVKKKGESEQWVVENVLAWRDARNGRLQGPDAKEEWSAPNKSVDQHLSMATMLEDEMSTGMEPQMLLQQLVLSE